MRFKVVLNRDGGTLRTFDLDAFVERLHTVLLRAGHEVEVAVITGNELEDALDAALESDCDVVMVGGGDGTVSAAAGRMMAQDKALAVLPAGTMNLFARSLAIPLDLDEAVAAFAHGGKRAVDIATANGKPFVHQFSIGLHARLIKLREKRAFRSRLGKIWASVRAGVEAVVRPPRLRVALDIDGRRTVRRTAGIGVTNNVFGEGHLPYADEPDGGVLGVYITRAQRPHDLVRLFLAMARGRWKGNDAVDIASAKTVKLTLLSAGKRFGCAIDGELCDLAAETELRVHPQALTVLAPPRGGYTAAPAA